MTGEELAAWAAKHPPPPEWYEEDFSDLAPEILYCKCGERLPKECEATPPTSQGLSVAYLKCPTCGEITWPFPDE